MADALDAPVPAPRTPDEPRPAPLAQTQRLESLDVLRGVALLGILAMNVMVFAMPFAAYQNPTVYTDHEGTNRLVYWAVHTVFDLKMMGLFSMLFGAGVVVWSAKVKAPEDVGRYRLLWIRRMWWLLVIGMIHAWWIWEGDILVSYATCGLLVLWWLRRLPPAWLIVVACAFFLVHLLLVGLQGLNTWILFSESEAAAGLRQQAMGEMSAEEFEAARAAVRSFTSPTQAEMEAQLAAMQGDWFDVFRHRADLVAMMQVKAIWFYIFWRATAMMLFGAALTKLGVLTGAKSVRFYGWMATIGYAVGLPLVITGILYNESRGFELVPFATVGGWFNIIGAVPVMLGHAALVLLVVKLGALRVLTSALARVGQMAFTNYLMQSILCSLVFYGWGLGLAGELGRLGQELVVVGIWLVEILWSVAWLSRFRFGPAEWLWRSLTYWTLQPMRRLDARG